MENCSHIVDQPRFFYINCVNWIFPNNFILKLPSPTQTCEVILNLFITFSKSRILFLSRTFDTFVMLPRFNLSFRGQKFKVWLIRTVSLIKLRSQSNFLFSLFWWRIIYLTSLSEHTVAFKKVSWCFLRCLHLNVFVKEVFVWVVFYFKLLLVSSLG